MTDAVDNIFALFARFGGDPYGEDLSLARHMLQSAAMAETFGASPQVVAAALLHDIGYFLSDDANDLITANRDTHHEAVGAAWLSQTFDATITEPIALHVEAKRYLCAVEPGYFDALSAMSRRSLEIQGGIMSGAEAEAFARRPGCAAAVLLRRCDDRGKDVDVCTTDLARYRPILEAVRRG